MMESCIPCGPFRNTNVQAMVQLFDFSRDVLFAPSNTFQNWFQNAIQQLFQFCTHNVNAMCFVVNEFAQTSYKHPLVVILN